MVHFNGRFLNRLYFYPADKMVTKINGHNAVIFIIIDHNNDITVKDGNDRPVQSP